MRVSREVGRGSQPVEEIEQELGVAITRVQHADARTFEPCPCVRARRACREGSHKNLSMCGDSNEAEDDNPREANGPRAVEQVFPPRACRGVHGRLAVVGVHHTKSSGVAQLSLNAETTFRRPAYELSF